MKINNYVIFTFVSVFVSVLSFGQTVSFWTPLRTTTTLQKQFKPSNTRSITNYQAFNLDVKNFSKSIHNAPYRSTYGAKKLTNPIAYFPTPSGELKAYEILRINTLSKPLAAKYPNIQSFMGISVENGASTIRFTIDLKGLTATGFDGDNGIFIIDGMASGSNNYIIYSKKDAHSNKGTFVCNVQHKLIGPKEQQKKLQNQSNVVNDSQLRKLRIAIATTGEYADFHIQKAKATSGTEAQKKEAVLGAINTTMTRINGIFENEFSITMELIANNDAIIFLDADTDDLSNDEPNSLIEESQTVIDGFIGFENYDIGHTFSTGAGGLAQFNSPCTSLRAQGVTGFFSPVGDEFDINFVAHELGHQFGGQHVQNNDDERSFNASVEPGSGSSIMGYAGISTPNVQEDSDDYFNAVNIREMWDFIVTLRAGIDCGIVLTPLNNTPPSLADLNSFHVIPHSTPFVLTAQASDSDGDALTYCWEQQDQTPAPMPPESSSTEGPLFRSLNPTTETARYFPNLDEILIGNLQPMWEVIPTVSRNMNFSVTVRDNNPLGGQNAIGDVTVSTSSTGPFKVTSQNKEDIVYDQNTVTTVNWDVAGTTENDINTKRVNILLSYDGGLTFPEILVKNTNNDGKEKVIIPTRIASETCRIKVEPVDNVYFAINSTNFEVSDLIRPPNSGDGVIIVSPNPTPNGVFTIEFGKRIDEGRSIEVEIYDLTGKLVFLEEYTATFDADIDISRYGRGLFIVRVVRGNEIYTKKVFYQGSE